jgi:hypothetical protein
MSGLVNFDGNGIAVATLKAMGVIDNPLGFPVFTISASDFTCNFTYTVNPDRSFTMEQSICTGDIVYGPGAEVTKIEITGGESEGFIGQFKQVLTTSKVEPTEQVMTFNGFFGAKRLCTHTWTLVRARNARE